MPNTKIPFQLAQGEIEAAKKALDGWRSTTSTGDTALDDRYARLQSNIENAVELHDKPIDINLQNRTMGDVRLENPSQPGRFVAEQKFIVNQRLESSTAERLGRSPLGALQRSPGDAKSTTDYKNQLNQCQVKMTAALADLTEIHKDRMQAKSAELGDSPTKRADLEKFQNQLNQERNNLVKSMGDAQAQLWAAVVSNQNVRKKLAEEYVIGMGNRDYLEQQALKKMPNTPGSDISAKPKPTNQQLLDEMTSFRSRRGGWGINVKKETDPQTGQTKEVFTAKKHGIMPTNAKEAKAVVQDFVSIATAKDFDTLNIKTENKKIIHEAYVEMVINDKVKKAVAADPNSPSRHAMPKTFESMTVNGGGIGSIPPGHLSGIEKAAEAEIQRRIQLATPHMKPANTNTPEVNNNYKQAMREQLNALAPLAQKPAATEPTPGGVGMAAR